MITISENLLQKIYSDLRNERRHMMFYLTNSVSMNGLLSEEYSEYFMSNAKEEMQHVKEFQEMIVGLGGSLTAPESIGCDMFMIENDVRRAVSSALYLEEQVVENYALRIEEIENDTLIDIVTKKWLVVFYEDQLKKSRTDVDKYKRLIA
jgi:bacterioferritin (cytochrome b1)